MCLRLVSNPAHFTFKFGRQTHLGLAGHIPPEGPRTQVIQQMLAHSRVTLIFAFATIHGERESAVLRKLNYTPFFFQTFAEEEELQILV